MDKPFPGADQLAATPEILRALFSGLTLEQTEWKPAPDRFSIAEVLAHLSHVEGHAYRYKLERMIEEDNPEVPVYDVEALTAAGQYSGRDAEDSFDHFEEQRESNLEYLSALPPDAFSRTARHQRHGTITVENLLAEWACHDLGHVRQVAELVRAIRYYPRMGPYREAYQLKP